MTGLGTTEWRRARNGQEKGEVPYHSYGELQDRWEAIEAAVKRANHDERRKRAIARNRTEEKAR